MEIDLTGLPLKDLKYKIADISSGEKLETSSVEDWREFFASILVGYATTRYNLNPHVLYRARRNFDYKRNSRIEFFHNTKELWAPDPKDITTIGRCNDINESILYCSFTPNVTLFELKPKVGLEMTVLEYEIESNLENINVVSVDFLSGLDIDLKEIFKNHLVFEGISKDHLLKIKFIENFITEEFTREIDSSNEFHYKITAGLTKFFLKQNHVDGFIGAEPSNGLVYPSVALRISGINFAIKPEYAATRLIPNKAFKYKILGHPSRHYYVIQMTHESEKIKSDGEILWNDRLEEIEYITDLPV
jgi:hypothetical protein